MDHRTALVLAALDATAADLLVELLAGPAREAELTDQLLHADQWTVNRRLHALMEAGLVHHQAGKPHAPGRPWSLAHPSETEQLLDALIALADAISRADQDAREKTKSRLKRAKAERRGIRAIKPPQSPAAG